jgi:hypothetical protein
MPQTVRFAILRVAGIVLISLGMLHLAVTGMIVRIVQESSSGTAAAWLVPPMVLNHVVVGLLLLPLGALTIYAAPYAARGERWAVIESRITAVTVTALPVTVAGLMGAQYFRAVPFVIATVLVSAAALLLLAAAFWPNRDAGSADPGGRTANG